MYPDAGGARQTFADMAQQLADYGYAVLVPDVYYRDGDWAPFDMTTVFSDPDERKRLFGDDRQGHPRHMASRRDGVLRLPRGATGGQRHARSAPPATAWVGAPRWWSPAACPTRVAAAMSFHGGGLASDDPGSPHLLADQMRAAVYVGAAPRTTRRSPPSTAETLDKALTAAGVEHTIEFYPAAHGFAVPDHAAVYDPAAAQRHWDAMEGFFGAKLG